MEKEAEKIKKELQLFDEIIFGKKKNQLLLPINPKEKVSGKALMGWIEIPQIG